MQNNLIIFTLEKNCIVQACSNYLTTIKYASRDVDVFWVRICHLVWYRIGICVGCATETVFPRYVALYVKKRNFLCCEISL